MVLLARHFPDEKGGRNDGILALSGSLPRGGLLIDDAILIVSALCTTLWGSKRDLAQAEREVRETYKKFKQGQATTGFPQLCTLIPEEVVRCALGWIGIQPKSKEPSASQSTERGHSNPPIPDRIQRIEDIPWITEVASEHVEWILKGIIPAGVITLFTGAYGTPVRPGMP